MSEKSEAPKKKHRLRRFFLGLFVVILVLGIVGFAYFSFVLRPGLNRQGKAIVANAIDYSSTEQLQSSLEAQGLAESVDMFVFNLADANATVDPINGKVTFVHIDATAISPDITLDVYMHQVASVMISAQDAGVDIRQTSVFVYEEGQAMVSLLAPLESLRAWNNGSLSDEDFLSTVNIKVEDMNQLKLVVERYINDRIGEGLVDALLGKLFGD